eukprot:scaffold36091_cov67-Phaeocystis_antarctica.AAC.6
MAPLGRPEALIIGRSVPSRPDFVHGARFGSRGLAHVRRNAEEPYHRRVRLLARYAARHLRHETSQSRRVTLLIVFVRC